MKRVTLWNVGLLLAALTSSTAVGWAPRLRSHAPADTEAEAGAGSVRAKLLDHGGVELPAANYARIASVSTVADQILWEICEPDRVVSVAGFSARSGTRSYRFSGKPGIESVKDIETLLALHPDLVLVSSFGDDRPLARLREAGLHVFDLGAMRGLATLVPNIEEISTIVGHPERGAQLARALVAEMSAVAADIAPPARKRGLYLSLYGGHLFGGGQGTSYHDVLTSAGLLDVAATFRDFPEYSVEQVLTMAPEVIITNRGMRERICEHAGFATLGACASPKGIVEVEEGLLGDPGPSMLDAAEAVRTAVHGSSTVPLTKP